MRMIKQLRSFWILWVTTIVMACFSDAVAQTSYKVTDLGRGESENEACAMSVNDEGWTEIMTWNGDPEQNVNFIQATLLSGRALIGVDGLKFDLGTLGGKNSWMNWGEINDFGQIVGMSETAVPDPNGEDICGFGTHLTCRPFLWQDFHMSALPTLGGNNGEASAINIRGQIVGFAENGALDTTCPTGTTNDRISLPVSWENGTAVALQDLGTGATAQGINHQGQIVGTIGSADGSGSDRAGCHGVAVHATGIRAADRDRQAVSLGNFLDQARIGSGQIFNGNVVGPRLGQIDSQPWIGRLAA